MLKIALVYPELLGTYGDGGNALVLAERARRRGIDVDVVSVAIGDDIPDASIYLLGGGEDGPQRLGADLLRESSFASRVRDGGYVFAVCAGLQLLGTSFAVEGDDEYEGLGLVPAVTRRGLVRSVGELLVQRDRELARGFRESRRANPTRRGTRALRSGGARSGKRRGSRRLSHDTHVGDLRARTGPRDEPVVGRRDSYIHRGRRTRTARHGR